MDLSCRSDERIHSSDRPPQPFTVSDDSAARVRGRRHPGFVTDETRSDIGIGYRLGYGCLARLLRTRVGRRQ